MAEFRPSTSTGLQGRRVEGIPILDGEPSLSELPVDTSSGNRLGLEYVDSGDERLKVTIPDGGGGVSTLVVGDYADSVTLGAGDETGPV